jgi:hypothetical protein
LNLILHHNLIYLGAMFFRRKKSPSGQCLQLLEAYRNAQGAPRHRVVVSLGNALIPEADWPVIAHGVERELYRQSELIPPDYSASVQRWIDAIAKRVDREGRWQPLRRPGLGARETPNGEVVDGVLMDQVSHTRTTPLGPSLVGLAVWKKLEMPKLLVQLGFNQAQAEAAAISVIGRLVAPGSELALSEWLPDSSLPELLGVRVTHGVKDRFYRISDMLLAHQEAIERHLRIKQGQLFQLDRSILLYDLTNSYFEGEALQNPKAKPGHSKHKRDDCPQIVVGMVFDREGFALAHKVFAGNQTDGKSLFHGAKIN